MNGYSMISLLCAALIIILVFFRNIAINGALSGLMLWYNCVVPALLPFIIISNIFIAGYDTENNYDIYKGNKPGLIQLKALFSLVFTGILCGYPIGAKTGAELLKKGICRKICISYLLPLCNNASPMFIAGYIHKQLLADSIPLPVLFICIYIPYLIPTAYIFAVTVADISANTGINYNEFSPKKDGRNKNCHITDSRDLLMSSAGQITIIGIYIMIFSILLEFFINIPDKYKIIKSAAAFLEITRGSSLIHSISLQSEIKTALIVSLTSFGGISALYQTNEVIKSSGLSIVKYSILKTFGGVLSGLFAYVYLMYTR